MSKKVIEIASFFLEKQPYMTHKKIQKLVYYAYSWYIVKNNTEENISKKLFYNRIEAWVHGPVCRELYDSYPIKYKSTDSLTRDEKEFLEKIWKIYGEFTGAELEDLTHQEEPWKKAREGLRSDERSDRVIRDIDIYNYYRQKIN